ncbi:MAG TPA: outer membrane beta-barrel protein [Bacteroidia bacterium]|nr:outer membrane beta-barrel protein [Bacteroidia bacterium]
MKKTFLLLLVSAFAGKVLFAQDGENDLKNFRFGLKATGMLTWYKPDDKKKYESNGVSTKGSYGLSTEFRLNKVAVIATGLQVDYDGGKLNMLDTNYYFLSKDSQFMTKSDTAGQHFDTYWLRSRTYNTTYLTIPLTLKLKTNEIGFLTYYGQFGVNASFKLKSRVNDKVTTTSLGSADQKDLDNTSDMSLFRFALNIGGGAEYNLSGSTSMVFGINWYNGFSNVIKSDSKYLFRTASNSYAATPQKATSNAIALTVGVLF